MVSEDPSAAPATATTTPTHTLALAVAAVREPGPFLDSTLTNYIVGG